MALDVTPFLCIPVELRVAIYGYVFTSPSWPRALACHEAGAEIPGQAAWPRTAILATCSQVHAEAQGVLFAACVFPAGKFLCNLDPAMCPIPQTSLSLIRRITTEVDAESSPRRAGTDRWLMACAKVAGKLTALGEVEVRVKVCRGVWLYRTLVESLLDFHDYATDWDWDEDYWEDQSMADDSTPTFATAKDLNADELLGVNSAIPMLSAATSDQRRIIQDTDASPSGSSGSGVARQESSTEALWRMGRGLLNWHDDYVRQLLRIPSLRRAEFYFADSSELGWIGVSLSKSSGTGVGVKAARGESMEQSTDYDMKVHGAVVLEREETITTAVTETKAVTLLLHP